MRIYQFAELVHLFRKQGELSTIKSEPAEVGHLCNFVTEVAILYSLRVCVCVCMCVHGCVRMEGAGPTSHTLSCRSELPQTLNWVREKSTPLTNGRTEAIFSLSPDYFNSSVNSTRQSVTRPSILTSLIVDNQPHNHMMLCDIMISHNY